MAILSLSGSGHVSSDGSVYERVQVSGSGTIDGDLRCREIHLSGAANVRGNVYCEGDAHCSGASNFGGSVECNAFHASGACNISKDLKCKEARISGACKAYGSVDCNEGKFSGATEVHGDITFKELTMSGAAKIKGNASGDMAKISGVCEIGGLLNAESIEIHVDTNGISLSNYSIKIKEIGCTSINVVPAQTVVSSIFKSLFGKPSMMWCEVIEGDEVSLCSTKAKVVRGRNVRIGEGCEIERVEYSGTIEVVDGSKVGERVKI